MEASPKGHTALPPWQSNVVQRVCRFLAWGLLVTMLLVMMFVRMRLLDIPLERDEGEYAYAGQLLLQGVPPYQECYNMKWPGTYVAYAGSMAVFGETAAGIHLGVLLVNLASALLVFLIGRRIAGEWMGVVAACTQALLSMSPAVLGLAGHATHFVALPALVGIWMLMMPLEKMKPWRCIVAGIFFGIACIMKQPGAVFGVFAMVWLAWRGLMEGGGRRDWHRITSRIGFLVAGGMLTLFIMAGMLGAAGVWGKFWHWTVEYAHAYGGIVPFSRGMKNLARTAGELWAAAPGLWLLAALGIVFAWCDEELRQRRFFLTLFAVFSFAGVCPGLYFREHYFLLLLPAASLLCGAAICALPRMTIRLARYLAREAGVGEWEAGPGFALAVNGMACGLFLLASGHSLALSGDIFFQLTPEEVCHKIYGLGPFPQAIAVSRYIAEHSAPDARIAVLGSEPEIYFYSHRRSATGYIYTYPLMEPQPYARQMQDEMIAEIEKAKPEYLVAVSVTESWLRRPDSSTAILDWYTTYSLKNYDVVGVVDILPGNETNYHWDSEATGFNPVSSIHLVVHRRKVLAGG